MGLQTGSSTYGLTGSSQYDNGVMEMSRMWPDMPMQPMEEHQLSSSMMSSDTMESTGRMVGLSEQIQQLAAIRIQAAFRGHSDRRLLKRHFNGPAWSEGSVRESPPSGLDAIGSPIVHRRNKEQVDAKGRVHAMKKSSSPVPRMKTPCLVLDDLIMPSPYSTHKAAVHIQRVFRGHAVRKDLQQSIPYGEYSQQW